MAETTVTTNTLVTIIDGQGNPQIIETTTNPIVEIKNSQGILEEYILTGNPQLEYRDINIPPTGLPAVSGKSVTNITTTQAQSGGIATDDGGGVIVARGCCWSTSQNPTTANSHTTDGMGMAEFISTATGLTPGTQYYLRAYVTNQIGSGYGAQKTFTTLS